MKIKEKEKRLQVPRYVVIIATRLNMVFQPNRGSSFYKRTPKKMIKKGQENWNSPVGTLRLSNHWGYENRQGNIVYVTDVDVPRLEWALCVNTNLSPKAWKVLVIFKKENKKDNIIRNIDFNLIKREIDSILLS